MKLLSALVASASLLVCPLTAHAQEETHEGTNAQASNPSLVLPNVLVDLGGGYAGPPMPQALATKGYSLGQILYGDIHIFPFSFRELGFVGRLDATMLQDSSGKLFDAPTIFSITGGPELQTRAGMVVFRGAVLTGARFWSADGVNTVTEPRVAVQFQTDFVFGAERGSSLPVFGFFGGIDVVPNIGWSLGTTISFAVF